MHHVRGDLPRERRERVDPPRSGRGARGEVDRPLGRGQHGARRPIEHGERHLRAEGAELAHEVDDDALRAPAMERGHDLDDPEALAEGHVQRRAPHGARRGMRGERGARGLEARVLEPGREARGLEDEDAVGPRKGRRA